MFDDPERCYQASLGRDARFDGWFFVGVMTTGIYCRPSCPAPTPKRENVRFFASAAAAQQAGLRSCRRCRPDATPGSPEWNSRADVAGRAMKLIRDGIVDREGVAGLARRLGYSVRQINRVITAEVGAGPLALARAQRTQAARMLLETTDLPFIDIAFASGFGSVRQFNATIREVFADSPSGLRRRCSGANCRNAIQSTIAQPIHLRLPVRRPFCSASVFDHLRTRLIAGVETFQGSTYMRSVRLDHGACLVSLTPDESDGNGSAFVHATLELSDLRDLVMAVARCRQLLDLDTDPVGIHAALGDDEWIGSLVTREPGMRVPGAIDGFECAVRAVVGQQVSVQGARTVASRLVRAAGEALSSPTTGITHLFPSPEALIDLANHDPEAFAMPAARRRALVALSEAVRDGNIDLNCGADGGELRRGLCALPGIGVWTAEYVALRFGRDPDVFMPTDLGIRRAAQELGLPDDIKHLREVADRWRPWRSYAMAHLWSLRVGDRRNTTTKEQGNKT